MITTSGIKPGQYIEEMQKIVKQLNEISKDPIDAVSMCIIIAVNLAEMIMTKEGLHNHKCESTRILLAMFLDNGNELKKIYDSLPYEESGFRN